jgi:hypothetical protein
MTWTCNCGYENTIEYATNKQKLRCKRCGAVYLVGGLHIDGSPMLALIDNRTNEG